MRIALIAPPFIPVPPPMYGGTELFVGELACGLKARGVDVVVYANGESTVDAEVRWLYAKGEWPLREDIFGNVKDINHATWAAKDASDCDILHFNSAPGLTATRFVRNPAVYTLHHEKEDGLSEFYATFPDVEYVAISDFQRDRETMPRRRTIHHGVDMQKYQLQPQKRDYLAFIGRIAPVKGTHLAIEVAQRAGIPLKIAGEVQPLFREYFERQIKPHLDGRFIEYIGEADLAIKNELLGNARAMLFPIQWNEPFGLVMIEAMACGTPVLALPGGSVSEVVREEVSGCVRKSAAELAKCAAEMTFDPAIVRAYCAEFFSTDVMADNYLELYTEIIERTGDEPVELEGAAA